MMKQKIEKTADEKMWNRISQIPVVILVLLSGIDIVRFAILGDKTAFITFSMIAVVFMLYGMEKQNAIFISADCSGSFYPVF